MAYNSQYTGAQIDEAVGDVRSNKTSWSGKQDALLSAGAAVGDQIKVKAVDEDGKPTEWEIAVPGTDYATPAQLAEKQNALNINLANVGDMIRVDKVSAYFATKFAVAKAGQDYMKTGNIVKQTLVSTPTTPSEEYAINWQYG